MRTAISYLRYSSPEQAKGDSVRRQLEMSATYANENDLQIDTTFRDKGVSAFRGKNRLKGALSNFLKLVQSGEIKPGSVLLVEALDRLSRDELTSQLNLFLGILEAGIEIVTLADKRSFTKETVNANPVDLMLSLVYMIRGREESAIKSMRLSKVWAAKRAELDKEKLTARCPEWLKLAEDRKSFMVIPGRAQIVRRMFLLARKGIGKRMVAKELNKTGVKPWGRGRMWHDSYIQKILTNRAVIGEFQPYKIEEGKRIPVGEPIPDYFPAIINDTEFHKFKRIKRTTGPVGKNVSNLFTGLIFDGPSGFPMHYVQKGTRERGKGRWNYLINSARAVGKPNNCWDYKLFEEYALHHLDELDWNRLVPESKADKQADQRIGIEAKLGEAQSRLARLTKLAVEMDTPPKNILVEMSKYETEETRLKNELIAIDKKNSAKREMQKRIVDGVEAFKKLIRAGDLDSRLRLREEIAARVARIELYGDPVSCPEANESITEFLALMWKKGMGITETPTEWPRYKVTFVNGIEVWVFCRHRMRGRKKLSTKRDLTDEFFFLMPAAPIIANIDLTKLKKQKKEKRVQK